MENKGLDMDLSLVEERVGESDVNRDGCHSVWADWASTKIERGEVKSK